MPMPLQHTIDGALGQVIDEFGNLVTLHAAVGLRRGFQPDAVFVRDSAVVSNMRKHQDGIGPGLLELLALVDDHIFVVQKFVVREKMKFEGVGCYGSEDGAQADDADLDAAFEREQLRDLLFGQELRLSSL
jgi:hypothetical protein